MALRGHALHARPDNDLRSHNPIIDKLRLLWMSYVCYGVRYGHVIKKLKAACSDAVSTLAMPRQLLGYAREPDTISCFICKAAEDAYDLTCGHFFCEQCAVADVQLFEHLQLKRCPFEQCNGRCFLPRVASESPVISPNRSTFLADQANGELAIEVCPICYGDRGEGPQLRLYAKQSKPIRLNCGHVLCTICFNALRDSARIKLYNSPFFGLGATLPEFFTCPTCRVSITDDSRTSRETLWPQITVIRFEDRSGLVVEEAGIRLPARLVKANTNVMDLSDTRVDIKYPKDVADVCDDAQLGGSLLVAATPNEHLRRYGSGGWGMEFAMLFNTSPWYPFTVPWCLEALKDLTVFYRVHFGPIILAHRPLLMCGQFSAKPLVCFDKYISEFAEHTSFLELSDQFHKELFFEGIPELSTTFRTLLHPQVVDPEITFGVMLELGRHALTNDPNTYLSVRHPGPVSRLPNKRNRMSDL